jgi:pyruvate dehydrogenase E2 component (dihydrolipoamide acetyltransferase)
MAIGAASPRVLPDLEKIGEFRVANIVSVTLSADHRVVDGALAAQWGQAFRQFVEIPESMLL